MVLRHKLGERTTPRQERRRKAGIAGHDAYHRAITAAAPDSPAARRARCFVASAILGPDHPATDALRHYRDQVLGRTPAGRWLIACYYRLSPPVARWLIRHPRLAAMLRGPVGAIARRVGRCA